MKILKSKTSHPKKTTLKISDLTYNRYYENYNPKLTDGVEDIIDIMNNPIEVFKHKINPTQRYGADGKHYKEKLYSVEKGNQRVTQAKRLGYTHIEAIVNEH
jgi:hypothetical protein